MGEGLRRSRRGVVPRWQRTRPQRTSGGPRTGRRGCSYADVSRVREGVGAAPLAAGTDREAGAITELMGGGEMQAG